MTREVAWGPVPERERILALDVLRGFALLGILMVNALFFALPLMQAYHPAGMGEEPLSERVAYGFVRVLFEYKFVSLFSLLFGIGLVVQMQRARARGREFIGTYLRRIFLLGVIGLLHGFLLWYGDILFLYACLGLLLMPIAFLDRRALVPVALGVVLFGAIVGAGCGSLQHAGGAQWGDVGVEVAAPGADPRADEPDGGSASLFMSDPSQPAWQSQERAVYREGPWIEAMKYRAFTFFGALLSCLFGFGWHVLGMFVLGAALMKYDFFAVERRSLQRRFAVFGLGIGLLLEGGTQVIEIATGYDRGMTMVVVGFIDEWGSVALCLGYVGALTLLANGGHLRILMAALARAGRMALTVYLLETVVMTAIMYWWGLGRFGDFSRLELIGLALVVYAGLVGFAIAWLSVFRIGPAEWAWRSLTYLRLQPILR